MSKLTPYVRSGRRFVMAEAFGLYLKGRWSHARGGHNLPCVNSAELPELEALASQLAVGSVVQVDLAVLLRPPRPRQGPSPYGPRTNPTHMASAAASLHRLAFR